MEDKKEEPRTPKVKPSIYCVKCRKSVTEGMDVVVGEITFNRKNGTQGKRHCLMAKCPICGINMNRFVKLADLEAMGLKAPEKTN
jgi:hypothetical protein